MTTMAVISHSSVGRPGGDTATYSNSNSEFTVYSQRSGTRRKIGLLLGSCVLSAAICLASLLLGLAELAGVLKIAHPLFWFPITVGGFGISGSSYIYLRRIWEI